MRVHNIGYVCAYANIFLIKIAKSLRFNNSCKHNTCNYSLIYVCNNMRTFANIRPLYVCKAIIGDFGNVCEMGSYAQGWTPWRRSAGWQPGPGGRGGGEDESGTREGRRAKKVTRPDLSRPHRPRRGLIAIPLLEYSARKKIIKKWAGVRRFCLTGGRWGYILGLL